VTADLETLWQTRGLSPSRLTRAADGTIVAEDRRALAESQTLLVDQSGEGHALALSTEPIVPDAVLGRGGMGVVRLGHQGSLRRQVAVKTVLDLRNAGAVDALLKEAWVGGTLEHPNVVPVHLLGRVEGGPAMVMKRVEGRSWSDVIEADAGRHLEKHLRIFLKLCDAIRFAHSRGVLHLDLKPENVMVGDYGEVYVVDWGLAVGLGERAPRWLMRAASIQSVAGTPDYMAPELVAADAEAIDERTDVYLLGATLHHVLTGGGLHHGEDLMGILRVAYLSEPPEYGPEVPESLQAIVRRAVAREPEDRFASVEALSDAVSEFLVRRQAERFVARARATVPILDEAIAAESADVEQSFAEAEMALEQAARIWGAHPKLDATRRALLERRVGHAIAQERVEGAKAALVVLADAGGETAELARRVAELEAKLAAREAHVARLETLRREVDINLGRADRRALFAIFGVLWAAVNVAYGVLTRSGVWPIGYAELLTEGGVLLVTLGPLGWWKREVYFPNRANRQLFGGLIFTAFAIQVFWSTGMILEMPATQTVSLTPLIYLFAWTTLALVVDRRLGWGSVCLVATAASSAVWPEYAYDALGVGGLAAVLTVVWAWRPRARP